MLTNDDGPALAADGLTVDSNAHFEGMRASGHDDRGTVRLTRATIKGRLFGDFAEIAAAKESERLAVEGMTYQGIPLAGTAAWLSLVQNATPSYAAQPYRQLASATTAAGHDHDTRQVLIAQRRDQLKRASTRWSKIWGGVTWVTLGYGYQPWRAMLCLLAITIAFTALTVSSFGHQGLYVKDHLDQQCSVTERLILGVDTALPLVTTTVPNSCITRSNTAGQVVALSGVATQLAGWAFATLFVAGFTGAVRKT